MSGPDLTIGPPPAPEVEPDDATSYGLEDASADEINAPHVDETVVRTMLRSVGNVASFAIGRDDVVDHWRFTPTELDDLTPPLTRLINRRPQLRAAVARGDEAAVAIVLASYTGRNVAAGRRAHIEEKKAHNAELQREADDAARSGGSTTGATTGGNGSNSGHGYGFSTPPGGAVA